MAGSGASRLYVGTSGFQYDHWKPEFYPPDLPKKSWFDYYARHFRTVEINNTFYSLPRPDTFVRWREQAPKGFRFALKFSRFGSHIKRLKDPGDTIGRFLDVADHLGPALGPVLVQLPPRWRPDISRLENFLDAAPKSHQWVFEFRDERWLVPEVFELLHQYGAGLCIHDMLDHHPMKVTADPVYLRFHGDHYSGRYTPQLLNARARKIAEWLREKRQVFIFFNNDAEACAVKDAFKLQEYVGRKLKA